ncbi:MAG: helical backbone metal receptor [Saprospiraceae bacterium]|nr:helical backbone metal receptor [Saprospiraceae bacterium]
MTFTDQMGRPVILSQWPPRRIVSLVPSQTEFLAALGLDAEVVGITKFCIRPSAWFKEKTSVGGTKTIHYQRVADLHPDLILGNKEENQQDQILQLASHFPVWMSDISTLENALDMMRSVGELSGKQMIANDIAAKVEVRFAELLSTPHTPLRAAYLIWRKPYMVAAAGTFIDDMLQYAGLVNVFSDRARYPEVSAGELASAAPEVLLLSSEPYPFAVKHQSELQEICPNARIRLVDGELFSWYGSRLLEAPDYFRRVRETLG